MHDEEIGPQQAQRRSALGIVHLSLTHNAMIL
jgi:hypothetical protein